MAFLTTMPSTRTGLILNKVGLMLAEITATNGYSSDAGERVYVGKTLIDDEMETFPLITLLYEVETQVSENQDHSEKMNLIVGVYHKLESEDDAIVLENSRADLQTAFLFANCSTLGDYVSNVQPTSSMPLPRDDSQNLARLINTYSIFYSDVYGKAP